MPERYRPRGATRRAKRRAAAPRRTTDAAISTRRTHLLPPNTGAPNSNSKRWAECRRSAPFTAHQVLGTSMLAIWRCCNSIQFEYLFFRCRQTRVPAHQCLFVRKIMTVFVFKMPVHISALASLHVSLICFPRQSNTHIFQSHRQKVFLKVNCELKTTITVLRNIHRGGKEQGKKKPHTV